MSDHEPIPQKVTYIGRVDFRGKAITFGIKEGDRTKHTYIIGKSGMGKSTLLENLALQDINNGEGLCFIDPHGSTAEKLLDHIPESRIKDVVYFAPFDDEHPIGLNVLEKVEPSKRFLVANGLMAAFKKLFVDQFSARMEYVLNNIILALLENDGQTLLGVNRMLFDKEYRKFIVSNVTDPTVRDFWLNEYANYTDKTAQELAPAIQNKVGQFVSNPLIRNIIGQKKTSFNIRELMDEKKILIVNLSKGKVGEGNANLIGSLLITKIYLAAMSRADIDPYAAEKLPPFYFYVDEFQNFANESFASILSEARKYKLALTVAHQYIEQMTDEVKAAVFGNVGTMITFRVGATDGEVFEKEFAPYFILDDFVNLSAHQIYLRLMIDNQGSKPFSAHTLDPIQKPAISYMQSVVANSRTMYSKSKSSVEEEVNEFYKPILKEEKKRDPAYIPDEKHLPVREIRNGASLPPKRYEAPRVYDDRDPNRPQNSQAYLQSQQDGRYERRAVPRAVEPARRDFPQTSQTRRKEDVKPFVPPVNHSVTPVVRITPPRPVVAQSAMPSQENSPSPRLGDHFDEKPAMSLKDALARAMDEHKESSVSEITKTEEVKVTEKVVVEHEKPKKEVSEEVLRKLVEAEEEI